MAFNLIVCCCVISSPTKLIKLFGLAHNRKKKILKYVGLDLYVYLCKADRLIIYFSAICLLKLSHVITDFRSDIAHVCKSSSCFGLISNYQIESENKNLKLSRFSRFLNRE